MENKKNDFKKLNRYLKFGCFLCGYKAKLMQECSEYSRQKLKRITAAMLIIMTLWFFIGYKFSQVYILKLEKLDFSWQAFLAFLGGLVALFMVIQIERQIVLHSSKNGWIKFFRIVLGFLMAFIGSTIIDQIIFEDDIAFAKETNIEKDVEVALKKQQQNSGKELKRLDSIIFSKEKEKTALRNKKIEPTIKYYQSKEIKMQTADGRDTLVKKYVYNSGNNPEFEGNQKNIASLQEEIEKHQETRKKKKEESDNIKTKLEKEINDKKGFLKELTLMFEEVLFNSWVAMVFYIVLLFFMLVLELLVLFASSSGKDEKTDYEAMVEYSKKQKMPDSKK